LDIAFNFLFMRKTYYKLGLWNSFNGKTYRGREFACYDGRCYAENKVNNRAYSVINVQVTFLSLEITVTLNKWHCAAVIYSGVIQKIIVLSSSFPCYIFHHLLSNVFNRYLIIRFTYLVCIFTTRKIHEKMANSFHSFVGKRDDRDRVHRVR